MNTKIKMLTIFSFILIVTVALGACSSIAPHPAVAGSAGLPELPPEQVVQEFYDWYITYPGHPIVSGAYAEQSWVGESLVESVEEARKKGMMADPILCAQDVPESITAGEAVVEGSTARVHVTTSWEGHELNVELDQVDGEWKISKVICRAP